MSQAIYDKNVKLLEGYKYYYGPNLKEFLYNEEYHSSEDINHITVQQNEKIILCNETSLNKINQYENESYKEAFLKWKRIPLYLYYDVDVFKAILQEIDLNSLNFNERIVIIVGMDSFERYFENMQTILPNKFIGKDKDIIENKILEIEQNRERILNKTREEIKEYYENNSENILENIKSKKYKILFMTTRFLGFRHTRDLYEGSKEAGYSSFLAIEDNNISRIYYELYVNTYKPDIIFVESSFRFEINFIPIQPIFVTWILDGFKNVFDITTPLKLKERDIVCNVLNEDKRIWETGYKREELIELLFLANSSIYKKYNISEIEYQKYKCDIVVVSHNTNYEKMMNALLCNFDSKLYSCIFQMSKDYYELEYNEKGIYGCDLKEYIEKWLNNYNIHTTDNEFADICYVFMLIRYSIKKHILVRWLIEPEKYDIKLWGFDWSEMPEFEKYSMGPAVHGEMLSKIFQSSKIAFEINPYATYPARLTEATLSNSLIVMKAIDESDDNISCSKFMKLGKDIVCFHTKKELYEKLDYYLENNDERIKMINHTKNIIIDKMSPKVQASKVFNIIEERIKNLKK